MTIDEGRDERLQIIEDALGVSSDLSPMIHQSIFNSEGQITMDCGKLTEVFGKLNWDQLGMRLIEYYARRVNEAGGDST